MLPYGPSWFPNKHVEDGTCYYNVPTNQEFSGRCVALEMRDKRFMFTKDYWKAAHIKLKNITGNHAWFLGPATQYFKNNKSLGVFSIGNAERARPMTSEIYNNGYWESKRQSNVVNYTVYKSTAEYLKEIYKIQNKQLVQYLTKRNKTNENETTKSETSTSTSSTTPTSGRLLPIVRPKS